MVKKLELLMKQIEDVIEFAYEEGMYDDYTDLRDKLNHTQVIKERIGELESQYSMIWRIKIQLEKGIRTSKVDLDYVNKVHKEISMGGY
jgi:hypothetical protein|tara:strand:- start:310 stop:576 length:267 start_codon:yes stop_codon:yes gene_type:complete